MPTLVESNLTPLSPTDTTLITTPTDPAPPAWTPPALAPASPPTPAEDLYSRHAAAVYGVCYARLGNPAEAEDAAQDTFVRLLRAQPGFANERHERAWLLRVAHNLCLDRLKHWWQRRVPLPDQAAAADEADLDDITAAVRALPPRLKTVVYLYYYEGYKTDDIAGVLGERPSTVRNRLRDARLRLRQDLAPVNQT